MYEKTSLDDIEERDVDGVEPELKAVGYELRPEKMRPSVWTYAEGESNNRHRQEEQEELYYAIDGRFEMEIEGETVAMEAGDFVVVEPDAWRQITATEDGTLLAVGAPNVEDDAVVEE